jgi:hypothetical protein
LAGILQGLADAAGCGDVIIFYEDCVEEAHAVIGDAAGDGGALFQRSHAGRGFARVEDAAVCFGYGIGVLARQRGYAAEALQEIEPDAFTLKQRARVAFHGGEFFACRAAIAIVLQQDDVVKHLVQHFGSGEDERLTRDKGSARTQTFRYASTAGYIARADILFEREAHDLGHSEPSSFCNCVL